MRKVTGQGSLPFGKVPFSTLKSDKDAMSSSSSRVAQEAEILACC